MLRAVTTPNTRYAPYRTDARTTHSGTSVLGWKGFRETVNHTIRTVTGCYMAEPGWLDDIEIEVVEAALSLPGLDQAQP